MDITLATVVLGLVSVYLIYFLSSKKLNYWKERGVPAENPVPVLGNMKDILSGKKSFVEFSTDLYKKFFNEKYFGFFMFHTPVIVVRDLELINQVLIKDFTYSQDRSYAIDEKIDLMCSGLANLTGDKWRVIRHKLTPTFTSGKLKLMFNQIKECTEDVVQYLDKKKGQDVDARAFLFKFIIDVIGSTAFGMKVNSFNESDEDGKENAFLENSKNFFRPSIIFSIKFLLSISAPKLREFFRFKLIDDSVNEFFLKLTKDLIKIREKSSEKRNDFLQIMLDQKQKELEVLSSKTKFINGQVSEDGDYNLQDAEEPEDYELLEHLKNVKYDTNATVFTDNIIAAQTFLFISGGGETTAAVLSFVLFELAVHQDVQKRLQEEIDIVLSDQGFTYDSIKKMKYMEQVVNEVLRLRPPGGVLARICLEDYKMPGTNFIINKGCMLQIPVSGIHKDPQYFPDPESFNPDRFENMDAIPKGVFFPFGGGPRICIAMRLAMLEMKVFLAAVFSEFNVFLSEKTQIPLKIDKKSIIQHVIGGIWVQFERREKNMI